MIDAVLNLLFPVECVTCSARVQSWSCGALCRQCELQLDHQEPPICQRCGLPRAAIEGLCGPCLCGDTSFDLGRSALVFDERLRQIVHHFKYRERVSLARPLGRALARCLEAHPFEAACVVPMPLHRRRERHRGYNQADLLACQLGRRIERNILRRVRDTETQTGLSRRQRVLNLRGAFRCVRAVSGAVLLVDDILTTGATVNEAARTLKRYGAERVEVLSLARVMMPD